ncbi:hypothetical protein K440DRAFT_612201 [Wilcoxina mikolae CBS 423.85]|nr:hypothetical protein K440DRAFT_612201 [Wilcoxina mikolae CBS 423.85]
MSSNLQCWWSSHSTAASQRFVKINSRDQELTVYDVTNSTGSNIRYKQYAKHTRLPYMRNTQCFDWSPVDPDLVSVGQSSGEAVLLRLSSTQSTPTSLAVKQQRSCNSVSFNRDGTLLATGLDKVRSDFCLNIWDISQQLGGQQDTARPSRQLASSEAITSVKFTRDNPNSLVAGVAYRWVRLFDLRESPSNPAISCNSRCVYGLSLDLDPNYFAGYSDEGVVTVWDRRFARSNPAGEPALLFQRSMGDEFSRTSGQITHLRYSNSREGVLAVLNAGGGLRVYETAKILNQESTSSIGLVGSDNGIVEGHKSRVGGWRDSAASLLEAGRGAYGGGKDGTSTSGTRTPNPRTDGETLLVNRINDIVAASNKIGKTDKRIVCFDWMLEGRGGGAHSGTLKILAVKGDGSLEVLQCAGSIPSIAWGSRNEFAITCENDLKIMPTPNLESNEETIRFRRKSVSELEDLDDKYQSYSGGESPDQKTGILELARQRSNSIVRPEDFLPPVRQVLKNDICVVMRKRVEAGYLMDCAKNAAFAKKENQYLEDMWVWLDGAQECVSNEGMTTQTLNLSFLGVLAVWHGGDPTHPTPESRITINRRIRREDWTAACSEINKRYGRKKFDSCKTDFPEQRRLCLAICGSNYDSEELEQELRRLEENNEHSKAAGLALFHGKIDRCIKSLQCGGRALKLMSTAVAGYFATARDPSSASNGTWKELAGEMANELGDPYQRAIFAYIANSEWREVLDEIGVPIRERIGIALRWLNDEELTNYLETATTAAIKGGELEGIILTGVTEEAISLLQEYINRFGDVQTAALVAAFGSPRFFKDDRVDCWIESYRQLLNSWRLFHARAKFDVARGQASRDRHGAITMTPPQRQVYVRCANCDRSISHNTVGVRTGREDPRRPAARPVAAGKGATKPTVCPHCRKSLPRCAVCLLNLGTSKDSERDYDRWFNFCLSCNHGMHAGHAKEWFERHNVCPVPECECSCKM